MCSFCSWATTPFFQGLFKGSHRCTLPLLGKTTDVTFGASLIIAVRLNPAPVQTCAQRNTRVDWALRFQLRRRTVLFQISIQIISLITWNINYNICVLHIWWMVSFFRDTWGNIHHVVGFRYCHQEERHRWLHIPDGQWGKIEVKWKVQRRVILLRSASLGEGKAATSGSSFQLSPRSMQG